MRNGHSSASVHDKLIAGRYELEELTGSGGMSRVYRARDNQLGRRVAVKILNERLADEPEYVERFRREALAVARLNHPNIVTVIDRGEADGVQYIVFEHVDGEDLKQLIRRVGPLPVRRALDLAVQIGRALSFAHAHGVVHRDVKPQNVLLRDGNAKVTDFGIARADDLALEESQTETGTVLGTGDYISPEQARGERATEQSDVYSLGAVIYELLTGHVPFPAESAVVAAMRHATDPVPDVLEGRPDAPPRLAHAVERALAKDAGERWESMDSFVDELVACRSELPAPDSAQTMILPERARPPAPPMRPGRRRLRLGLSVLVVLLLGAAAAGAYEFWHRGHKTASPGDGTTAKAAVVDLRAVGVYDPPPGDGVERDDLVPDATDGSASTAWRTENYTTAQFGNLKKGVGIVLDAGKAVRLGSITIRTGTTGFAAEIRAGDSPKGPFPTVASSDRTVGATTTFTLHVPQDRRYYEVWITRLARYDTGDSTKPYGAQIAEVTAG
jgi:serine/threonine-protein kinase